MSLQPLNRVLNTIGQADQWRSRNQFQKLLAQWPQLVGDAVALQTQPLQIQRQVLYVATASAVWAQNLMFERHRLLQKINAQLTLDLTDIRFSTAQWSEVKPSVAVEGASQQLWEEHPSRVQASTGSSLQTQHPSAEVQDPTTAFQQWAQVIQARSQQLPLCPSCQCPTPPGELVRWTVCALCVSKQW